MAKVREGYYSEQGRNDSYFMLYDSLPEKRKKVFEYLLSHPNQTNQEIADGMKWQINCITPRIFELRKLGLVFFAGYRKDTKISTWIVPSSVWNCLNQIPLNFNNDGL